MSKEQWKRYMVPNGWWGLGYGEKINKQYPVAWVWRKEKSSNAHKEWEEVIRCCSRNKKQRPLTGAASNFLYIWLGVSQACGHGRKREADSKGKWQNHREHHQLAAQEDQRKDQSNQSSFHVCQSCIGSFAK